MTLSTRYAIKGFTCAWVWFIYSCHLWNLQHYFFLLWYTVFHSDLIWIAKSPNLCSYTFFCYCFYFSTGAFGFKLLTFIVITEHGTQLHIITVSVLWLTWSKTPKTKYWCMKMLNLFLEIYFPSPLCFRNSKLIVTANVSGKRIKTEWILQGERERVIGNLK